MVASYVQWSIASFIWSVEVTVFLAYHAHTHTLHARTLTHLYAGPAMPSKNPTCCSGMKAFSLSIISMGVTPSAFSYSRSELRALMPREDCTAIGID